MDAFNTHLNSTRSISIHYKEDEDNIGFLNRISTESLPFAQQAITDLNSNENPLPIAESFLFSSVPLSNGLSVQEQIVDPCLWPAEDDAAQDAPDLFAVAQSSATSSHLQPPFLSEDQQQNISSSISPTSEKTEAKTKKVSKRKQPEAPKSAKEKRKKTTSSKSVKAKPSSTEPDPLLKAIQAFQNAKSVKKGCIVKALRNCGMNTGSTEKNKLRINIHAIKACLHYKEIHGTISDKALRDICLDWGVSQSRIAKLLLVAEPRKEVYFKFHEGNPPKAAERIKSTSAKSVGASIEEEDPLVAAMIAFQNDGGINSIAKILRDNGLTNTTTRCELVRTYVYAIGDRFLHEEPDGTISEETLKKTYVEHKAKASRVEPLLEEARQHKQVYINYFQKSQKRKRPYFMFLLIFLF